LLPKSARHYFAEAVGCGRLERNEAASYRQLAAHPRTAKVLDGLADSYQEEARCRDEDAERLD